MEAYIINRITVENGTIEEFNNLCMNYTTIYTIKRRFLFNQVIFEKVEKYDVNPSYVNPETKILKAVKEHFGTELPEGIEAVVKEQTCIFPDFRKILPIPFKVLNSKKNKSFERAFKRGGIYHWCHRNWGSLTNSIGGTKIDFHCFEFLTSVPVPKIIDAMSKANPQLTFLYEYADEDGMEIGGGYYRYCDGELENSIYPGESKEAYEVLFNLRPEKRQNYEFVNGNYEFIGFE